MKVIGSIVVSLLTACSAFAFELNELTILDGTENPSYFILKKSLTDQGYGNVGIWIVIQNDELSRKSQSKLEYVELDCKRRKFREGEAVTFSKPFCEGKEIQRDPQPFSSWHPVQPGSLVEELWAYSCANKAQRDGWNKEFSADLFIKSKESRNSQSSSQTTTTTQPEK